MHHIFEPPNKEKKLRRRLRGCLHETGLTLVVLGLAFVLTARLNYGSIMAINSMEFNGVGLEYSVRSSRQPEIRLARTESQTGLM